MWLSILAGASSLDSAAWNHRKRALPSLLTLLLPNLLLTIKVGPDHQRQVRHQRSHLKINARFRGPSQAYLTSATAILTVFISCPSESGKRLCYMQRRQGSFSNGACQSQLLHVLDLFKQSLYCGMQCHWCACLISFGWCLEG